ncbi:glutathione S-transferase N-terminal domain-containing protein [Ancylobacter vacuolatus]|uniref:Glutathione S-transferase n=1 Tax=Ancylobacter vacuolatus TaxID=223389 RepID=A0ABU0DGK8_9HYPH|nr:glutathione S-transferase N-terminal domain-containing protein [Ancylobacter vacuolatus]MDQ0347556.1 glutathione S-transferase [Ancylobacter vacuolatus]
MKLLHAPTSPFVRKVMVVARETGLTERIEIVFNAASPLERDPALTALNPLGKIPALLLDDGTALYDSAVICEYLADLAGDTALFPTGPARWPALTLQALGDGLLDAAVGLRYESVMRPEPLRWPDWSQGQMAKIAGGLDVIEQAAHTGLIAPTLHHIGLITLGCALGYLDFRYADLQWRQGRPAAAAWFAAFDARPSMAATRPHERVA